MKKPIKFKEILKNHGLTDYEETKDMVINAAVKHVPKENKKVVTSKNWKLPKQY